MPPSIKIASPKDSRGITSSKPRDLAFLQSIEQLVNDWKHQLVESPATNRSASKANDALSTSDPFSSNPAIAIYEKHERFYLPLQHIYFVVRL
ncbi:hypothetical protein FIBSPDRAFT_846982 [Athelia psychrophila]|uniref:Uncharacterized protein n=1 Tax=Athelia psychrophila TaxID=1759441 RepID=A0A166WJZ1_9AGAM|nr:hypothetical protein FIBSPDRAFT_846982 [Fibularhizoctonia sp. CBS 109695]